MKRILFTFLLVFTSYAFLQAQVETDLLDGGFDKINVELGINPNSNPQKANHPCDDISGSTFSCYKNNWIFLNNTCLPNTKTKYEVKKTLYEQEGNTPENTITCTTNSFVKNPTNVSVKYFDQPQFIDYGFVYDRAIYNYNSIVKLGSETEYWRGSERISTTFQINKAQHILKYLTAIYLAHPDDHAYSDQPFFRINIKDVQTGKDVYSSLIVSSSNLLNNPGGVCEFEGFTSVNGNIKRDWTESIIDLANYVNLDDNKNHSVTISFQNADCSGGGHLSVSYVGAKLCQSPELIKRIANNPFCTQTLYELNNPTAQNYKNAQSVWSCFEHINGYENPINLEKYQSKQYVSFPEAGSYTVYNTIYACDQTYQYKQDVTITNVCSFDFSKYFQKPPAQICRFSTLSLNPKKSDVLNEVYRWEWKWDQTTIVDNDVNVNLTCLGNHELSIKLFVESTLNVGEVYIAPRLVGSATYPIEVVDCKIKNNIVAYDENGNPKSGSLCMFSPYTFSGQFKNPKVKFDKPVYWYVNDVLLSSDNEPFVHCFNDKQIYNIKMETKDCPSNNLTFQKDFNLENCSDFSSCVNCIAPFYPKAGERYLVSAWVKGKEINAEGNYSDAYIQMGCGCEGNPDGGWQEFHPTGTMVDGWQRIEGEVVLNNKFEAMKLLLKNDGTSEDVFFDDIRIHPVSAIGKSFVYDSQTGRLVAQLDENNYGAFYEYSEDGKLIRVKRETEKGIMTIQENGENSSQINKSVLNGK